MTIEHFAPPTVQRIKNRATGTTTTPKENTDTQQLPHAIDDAGRGVNLNVGLCEVTNTEEPIPVRSYATASEGIYVTADDGMYTTRGAESPARAEAETTPNAEAPAGVEAPVTVNLEVHRPTDAQAPATTNVEVPVTTNVGSAATPNSQAPAQPSLIFPTPSGETRGTMLDLLGRQIAIGQRTPGTVMTLAELEKEFSASRTVVREAIKVLESLGMVEPRRRVGITVLARAQWHVLDRRVISWRMYDINSRRQNLLEINSLRRGLEPEAARLAALRQPEAAADLLSMATRMRELGLRGEGASAEFLRTDITFHELITILSGNEIFAHLGAMIGSMLIERTHWNMQPDFPDIAAMDQHVRLAQAIKDGDQEVAQAASSFIVIQADDEVRRGAQAHDPVTSP